MRGDVHVVGSVADFPPGKHRVVKIERREIGIFNIAGKLYALPNVCPHQTGPLCEAPRTTGTVAARAEQEWSLEWIYDGEVVTCPWHGMEFHVPTGQCLALKEIRLRQYDVRVENGRVVVHF
jgi:nitrite reductase/ring-hydroxylating ferredoxin subunit